MCLRENHVLYKMFVHQNVGVYCNGMMPAKLRKGVVENVKDFLLDSKKVYGIYQDYKKTLDKTIADIVQLLDEQQQTIATAESCTGGLLSQLITSVPGASRVFEIGMVTYAERMKIKFLQVTPEQIARYGVVSAEVALEMVRGLRNQSQAELCVSVTGLAGPGGGTPEKPVGTVYVGILYGEREVVAKLELWQYGLHTRQEIRYGTAVCAFGIVKQILMEEAECRKKKRPQ